MLLPPLIFLGGALPSVERASSTVPPLVNFQVQQPPALPLFGKKCTVELVHHLFGNSYYHRMSYMVEGIVDSELTRELQLLSRSILYVVVTRLRVFLNRMFYTAPHNMRRCWGMGRGVLELHCNLKWGT